MNANEYAQTVREALGRYGRHEPSCRWLGQPTLGRCTCGYLHALALAEQLRGALDDAHTAAMDFQTHAEQLRRLADDRLALMKAEEKGWQAECDELKAQAEHYLWLLSGWHEHGKVEGREALKDLTRVALAGHAPEPGDET